MKFKPKSTRTTILILVVAAVLMVIAYFMGFTSTRSTTRIGYSGNEGWRSWSGSYAMLSGSMQKTIHPKDTETTLHIDVITKSGNISIQIFDKDRNVIFKQTNIGTEAFEVSVSGKVIVRIDAEQHKGSFSIS